MSEPVFVGLLLADRAAREEGGKHSINGTFAQFNAQTVPAVFPPWYVYAAVTNLQGSHDFTMNLALDKNSQVLASISGQFETSDRKACVELILPMLNVVFPSFGEYSLTFLVDNRQIGSRLLMVNQVVANNN